MGLNSVIFDFYGRMCNKLAGFTEQNSQQKKMAQLAARKRRRREAESGKLEREPGTQPPPQGKPIIPGVRTKVFCAGYDWRGDAARAAFRVAKVVEAALEATGEKQVIIVAHSMGGVVSRYYSRVLGGESKIFRLFLIFCLW